jgi:hypothetical protein
MADYPFAPDPTPPRTLLRWILTGVAAGVVATVGLALVRAPSRPAATTPKPVAARPPEPVRAKPQPEPVKAVEKVAAPAEAPTPAASPSGPCQARVVSRPARTDVWHQGHRLGRTGDDGLLVPCGAELVLARRRYQRLTVHAPAAGDAPPLDVQLVRPSAHLKVTSEPAGAEVRIRGRTVGRTPANLSLPRYEWVSLEVRGAGARGWKKRLYVRRANASVRADLTR